METDPFATTEIGDGDDPFAGTDFGDFDAATATAEPEMVPVVNAEGETVGEAPKQPDEVVMSDKPVASFDPTTREFKDADGNVTSARPPVASGPTSSDPAAERAAYAETREGPAAAVEAPPAPPETETAGAPPAPPVEPPPAPPTAPEEKTEPADTQARLRAMSESRRIAEQEAAEDVADAAQTHDVDPEPSEPEPSEPAAAPAVGTMAPVDVPEAAEAPAEPEGEPAPVPDELKDAKGRVTHRQYVILRPTSPGKFEQVAWHVNKDGEMAPKGPGTKKQNVTLARTGDDALAVAYKALGAPPEGIMLVAVSQSHFQIKPVRPKPVEPSRTRLQIG
jgi:hypothetical protein